MIARRYILRGRVQGVGFRYFTYEVARELGIQGWVRNRSTGEVEIRAQGSMEAMRQFMTRIQSGPSLAMVEGIEAKEVELKTYTGFLIGT